MREYRECEHLEGNFVGKCAICGQVVCEDCFRSVYDQVICNAHDELEEEVSWSVGGYYSEGDSLEDVRFALEKQAIDSLIVESDADLVELYIPREEKKNAWEVLRAALPNAHYCMECKLQFSTSMRSCPECGGEQIGD